MDWILLAGVSLLLFCIRDGWLLAVCEPTRRWQWRAAWSAVQSICFVSLGLAAESVSRDRAHAFLREPMFWGPAVAIHLALWAAFTFIGRGKQARAAGHALMLLPTPMFLFAAGALVWLSLTRTALFSGWSAGVAVAMAWIGVVLIGSAWHSRSGPDSGKALEFAATVNLSALLLIPIQQSAESQSGLAEQPVDWLATLLPLGLTASLIALSYLFHRFRSARRSV